MDETFLNQADALDTWRHGHHLRMAELTAEIAALEARADLDHANYKLSKRSARGLSWSFGRAARFISRGSIYAA